MLPGASPNRFAPRVEARSQVLAYRIPVVGTGLALHYSSDRVPGRRASYQLRIPLRGTTLPDDVEETTVEIAVGDQRVVKRFPASQTEYVHDWGAGPDDPQAADRHVLATIRVGYVHRAIWPRPERIRWREHSVPVGVMDVRRQGLGGWTLTAHHAYDAVASVLYLGDGDRRPRLAPSGGRDDPSGEVHIPSDSGGETYVFGADELHLRTLDGATGGERFAFAHDAEGRLQSVRFTGQELCRIQRGEEGNEVAIIAPGGARTSLNLDEAGYLRAIVDPAGGRIELHHGDDGLLREIVDPLGNAYRFAYDELGRLTSEEQPGGGGSVLRRTATTDGFTVRRSTATGAELVYGVERLPGGVTRRVNGCCAGGGQTIAEHHADGRRRITYPDGSTLELEMQPDPRFGSSASVIKRLVRRTPAGLMGEAVFSREAASGTQTDRLLLNGRPFVIQVDGAQRRMTFTSAEGRTAQASLDDDGRLVGGESAGVPRFQLERDEAGRVVAETRGAQRVGIRHDDRGRVTRLEFGTGGVREDEYDAADRLVSTVLPGDVRRRLEYDAGGNLTALIAPSGAAHRFRYGPTNRWTSYETPTGERYEAAYNPDGRPNLARLPGGREVRMEYDETGWLRAIRSPEAVVELRHDAAGRVAGAERQPLNGEPAQSLELVHDGPLVKSARWRGPSSGAVAYSYDADFRLASIDLEGGEAPRQLGRDGDGLITRFGPFSVKREGPDGAVSAISDGRMVIDTEFDASGRFSFRAHRVGGQDFYRLRVQRSEAGGIRSREEALTGRTLTRAYLYDERSQLVGVDREGSASERYTYDANGNRVSQETETGSSSATFDAADRLLSLGEQTREMDGDGGLRRRGEQTLEYGARGELLRFTAQDGAVVRYTHDGMGRLVARTDAAGTEQYLLNHVAPLPELLASRSAAGVTTEYFFDAGGHLFALLRSGAWFYVACDEIGSPRIVVDAEGNAVKVLEYDAFGATLTDSQPEFELRIGFAGGLVDPSSGLVRFGRRDYDPQAGRWTTPDPAGFLGDTNLYRYAWNDPVNVRDPAGTLPSSYEYQHQSPTDPVFHPEPGGTGDAPAEDTGPRQWEEPKITPPSSNILDNLAGEEPTPGGKDWKRGWDWNKYSRKGRWYECQASVGGLGESASPYAPDMPGADPGGGRESGPSRGGVTFSGRF